MISDLDIKILKTLLSDAPRGMEFIGSYNQELFASDARIFVRFLISYLKAFRTPPTRRVLKEWTDSQFDNYIDEVFDATEAVEYNVQEYPFDLEQLKKRYSTDTLNSVREYLTQAELDNNPEKLTNDVLLKLQTLRSIREGKSFTQRTVKEYVDEFQDRYDAREANPEENRRIKTHYSAIDFALGGFNPAELFLVGGETGGGKSMLLMNMAIQMWMQENAIYNDMERGFEKGYNILYFSLEMPYEDMFARFMARLANVEERHILDGKLDSDGKERMAIAKNFIKHYPFEFDIVDIPRNVTIHDIELRFQDALLKYKPDVVLVDYMGLMHSNEASGQPDWLKMGYIAGELHEFGRAHGVCVGSALQLTDFLRQHKGEQGKGKNVGGHRIGRSSMILHHANFYLQIESRENEDNEPTLLFHTVKNRRGPKPVGIKLKKNFANSSLLDIAYVPHTQNQEYTDNDANEDSGNESSLQDDISQRVNSIRTQLSSLNKK